MCNIKIPTWADTARKEKCNQRHYTFRLVSQSHLQELGACINEIFNKVVHMTVTNYLYT